MAQNAWIGVDCMFDIFRIIIRALETTSKHVKMLKSQPNSRFQTIAEIENVFISNDWISITATYKCETKK